MMIVKKFGKRCEILELLHCGVAAFSIPLQLLELLVGWQQARKADRHAHTLATMVENSQNETLCPFEFDFCIFCQDL